MVEGSKRGGARVGAGRKPQGQEPMVSLTVRVLPVQLAKVRRLGGAAWVRKKIDQAKEPK